MRKQQPTSNRNLSTGDAVQHRTGGTIGVVVERLGRTRIVVSLDNRTTVVWYAGSVRTV